MQYSLQAYAAVEGREWVLAPRSVAAGNGARRRNPARAVTKGMKADFR